MFSDSVRLAVRLPPPLRPVPADTDTAAWSTCSFAAKLVSASWSILSTLRKEQDVTGIVEMNKADFNDAPARWGDGKRVASIPMAIYWELKRTGVADDQAALRRWLNDPDNRHFRTRPGVV